MAPWKIILIVTAKIIGLLIGALGSLRLFFWLISNPRWSPVMTWGLILLGWGWFVWSIKSRWYPALKQRLGQKSPYKVLLWVLPLAWLPGLWVARCTLNSITGVDAGNFPTALWAFTIGGMIYLWVTLVVGC